MRSRPSLAVVKTGILKVTAMERVNVGERVTDAFGRGWIPCEQGAFVALENAYPGDDFQVTAQPFEDDDEPKIGELVSDETPPPWVWAVAACGIVMLLLNLGIFAAGAVWVIRKLLGTG